jgi:hypothetical protein
MLHHLLHSCGKYVKWATNEWTTEPVCGSVTDPPISLALLQEIREMVNQRMDDRTELVFGDKKRREIHYDRLKILLERQ